jgi:cyclopropane-fatty-acyl-phospholipid synthase
MKLADVFEEFVGPDVDLEFVAYDGSKAGRMGSDVRLEVRSPRAVAALLGAPGQLGLVRAYVSGDLEVTGDLFTALVRLGEAFQKRIPWRQVPHLTQQFAPYLFRRTEPPQEEIMLGGRRHGKRRDAAAIAHHYDVSNAFYEWILGPSMAYTCAVFPTSDATLTEAQWEKFDLVCRKLDLRSGQRLLDVGCGWGGMARHAAEHYGVDVVAVTLSEQQARWGQRMIAEAGLQRQVDLRYGDYRDVPETGFDAVSSIGLTEHIGKRNHPAYFRFLRSRLRDEGRLLNHCITRTDPKERTQRRRSFINRYIFPDGELLHVGHLVERMEHEALEVQHEENLRQHYEMTLREWSANLEAHWPDAVAEVGERKARVWRLYLAASRYGFFANMIQLHQVLATRTASDGRSGMPLRPTW